jgi:hypothetical protein
MQTGPTGVAALDLSRPRDLGALLSATFSLYGRFFPLFGAVALIVVVPVDAIFYGGMLGWFGTYDPTPPAGTALIAQWGAIFIAQPLITAMHVKAVVDLGEGRRPTIGGTLAAGAAVFAPVLAVLVLYWLALLLGFVALVVPGLFLAVRLWVSTQAAVVEGKRGVAALRRSWELTKDNWWRIFGISIVVAIIGGVAAAILYVPGTLIADSTGSGPIALAGQIVGDAITLSFQALVATLLFFDLRARRETPGWSAGPAQPPPPVGGYQPPPPGYQPPPPGGYPPPPGPEAPR